METQGNGFFNNISKKIIVENFLKEVHPQPAEHPTIWMILGGVATGKTPMIETLRSEPQLELSDPNRAIVVSPKLVMPVFANSRLRHVRHPELITEQRESYYDTCTHIIEKISESRASIIFSDIGDQREPIERIRAMLQSKGYLTVVIGMVTPTPDYKKKIVKLNTIQDVRYQPEQARAIRFIRNWKEYYKKDFDLTALFSFTENQIEYRYSHTKWGVNNQTICNFHGPLTIRKFAKEFAKTYARIYPTAINPTEGITP